MSVYREKEKDIPIRNVVDVIVVGGGPAGVATATTCGELGLDTIIIEKNGFFGGSNVAGYSGTIGGLYSSSSDESKPLDQIVGGFANRFLELLASKNGVIRQFRFGHTALAPHDPFIWKEVADELVTNAQVKILFHTVFCDVVMDGVTVKGVIVESKSGREVIMAKRVIDCSGDGDVAYRAGAPYRYGHNDRVQAMTMVFRLANVDWKVAGKYTLAMIWELVKKADATGKYDLPRKHPFVFPAPQSDQAIMNCTAIIHENNKALLPTNNDDLSYAELAGRKQVREYERFARDYIEGFEKAYMIDTASMIGIRQGRTIIGEYTLTNDDVSNTKKFDHAIVKSSWPIELHGGSDGVKVINLDDDYYEIPFEVMIPKLVENVLVAGRCISAEHEALASARVVAQCFEEGMAAALATFLSIEEDILSREVNIKTVQAMMRDRGAKI